MEAPKGMILTVLCAHTSVARLRSPRARAPNLTMVNDGPGSEDAFVNHSREFPFFKSVIPKGKADI